MNRKLIIGLLAAVALGVAAYLVFRRDDTTAAKRTSAGSAAASDHRIGATPPLRNPQRPTSPAPPTEDPPGSATPFQRARARAMANTQSEITQRIATCAPSAAPPRPRPIQVELERRAEASTPEMQQYVVKEARLVGGNADEIPPAVRGCIDQLRGMPVPVFVNPDAIASEDQTMSETFEIPLP